MQDWLQLAIELDKVKKADQDEAYRESVLPHSRSRIRSTNASWSEK